MRPMMALHMSTDRELWTGTLRAVGSRASVHPNPNPYLFGDGGAGVLAERASVGHGRSCCGTWALFPGASCRRSTVILEGSGRVILETATVKHH